MKGNEGLARVGGAVALLGAFYTATYITSYRGPAPSYAQLALLAGTAGGILACARPRSLSALTWSAVLVGFAFTGAVVGSGIGFGPGLVLLIVAAVRSKRFVPGPHGEMFTGVKRSPRQPWTGIPRTVPAVSGGFAAMRDPVVRIPEAEPVVTLPEPGSVDGDVVAVSSDGRVQAGPPGVIGALRLTDDAQPPSPFGTPPEGRPPGR